MWAILEEERKAGTAGGMAHGSRENSPPWAGSHRGTGVRQLGQLRGQEEDQVYTLAPGDSFPVEIYLIKLL